MGESVSLTDVWVFLHLELLHHLSHKAESCASHKGTDFTQP
jgi:hypothetical protein